MRKNRVNQTTGNRDNIAPAVSVTPNAAEAAKEVAANSAYQDNPADRTAEVKAGAPQETPIDINSPTVSGFTADDVGLTNPVETPGLRRLNVDEANNLRTALSNVIGYQTGSTYRHDFESGLEVLRTFGFSYNVEQADVGAIRSQEDALLNERSQVLEQDDEKTPEPNNVADTATDSRTDTKATDKTEVNAR